MYAKCLKRVMDFTLSLAALSILSPVLLLLTVLGAVKMKGNPFFVQPRPGKDERIFRLIKFRSMTCETDENGKPLPDAQRLTGYGKFLRASSLDELPELINILIGDMSIVGPRPQLVRDMVFMTPEQRRRHSVMPGLTGLAETTSPGNRNSNMTWPILTAGSPSGRMWGSSCALWVRFSSKPTQSGKAPPVTRTLEIG